MDASLIIAHFINLLTKDFVGTVSNGPSVTPKVFYFWQSLTAPLLAGAVHFLLLRWLTGLIWQGNAITSVVIVFLGILPSYPIYALLYGLFGGWDNDTLGELRQSVGLNSFMRPQAYCPSASD